MQKVVISLTCFSFLIFGGGVFAEGKSTTKTTATKSTETDIKGKNLIDSLQKDALKKMTEQSSQFVVSDYLQVGKEAELKISAEDDKNNLIYRVTNMMISIIGIVAILFYVIAGFFIITASDENQLNKGKTIITYTSLGVVVAFASYLLVQVVLSAIFSVAAVS